MAFDAALQINDISGGDSSGARIVSGRELRIARLARDPNTFALTRLVARARGVPTRQILSKGRGTARAAAARQLAMYLAHVLLGRAQDDVGRLFGRDPSTVCHACRVVEDLRDDPAIEAEIVRIEAALALSGDLCDAA